MVHLHNQSALQKVLGGCFNPFEKYKSQIGSFPQCRGEIKKHLKPTPGISLQTPDSSPIFQLTIA